MGCCSGKQVRQSFGELPDGVEVLQRTPSEAEATGALLTRAFGGSATTEPELGFEWCLPDDLAGKWDDPRRHSSLGWTFRFVVEDCFAAGNGGAVLVCRTSDGQIGGAAACKVYRGKPTDGACNQAVAFWRTGMPKKDAEKLMGAPRMAAFEGALKRLHKAHATGPHVYVWAVGVDPSAQGQRLGGKLMRAASAIADSEGLPCYLETCGPKNPRIYERYGYAVVGEMEMRTKKGDELFEHPYLAMVRPAVQK